MIVAAYTSPKGCVLASSIEAKTYGIKTGMQVKEGQRLYPNLVVLPADPNKYRVVHLNLRKLLSDYTDNLNPKSIDEFVLDLPTKKVHEVALEIKRRITKEVGGWLKVSIGISTNRSLAKLSSNLKKPDGLEVIDKNNYLKAYEKVSLVDLHGINTRLAARLNSAGIYSVIDFYRASFWQINQAFGSVNSYYWYLRLRGWPEIDNVEFERKSFGNSYALSRPLFEVKELSPIIAKLVDKMATRLRASGKVARGIHLAINYRDGSYWHRGKGFKKAFFDTRDFYKEFFGLLLKSSCRKPVRIIAVSCFNLSGSQAKQLELFDDIIKKEKISGSIDRINDFWGDFTVAQASLLKLEDRISDRISFGGVKELEEYKNTPLKLHSH
ncbi:MAG: Nucleotidyltransferase/DNA polymerase involved in DNA repair [Candidatus Woesebacteria bacterium GW2011_GWA1_39_11b]|nr:MAG: Nucleotidyltransferase/DNA polymerase involved in DNA repair [Candidatus Woesebacteria bacterium GW2011_GWA1_39_11b]